MRITKGLHNGAVVTMGRYDAFGGRKPADPRDFMAAQREMRTAAEAFCRRHHLRGGYQVFACADAGGSMLDDVESVDMVSR